jgi:hypothetical protein
MKYKTRWLPTQIADHEAELGDLLIVEVGGASFLVFKAGSPDTAWAVVLADLAGSTSAGSLPRYEIWDEIADRATKVRRIDGDLLIEPLVRDGVDLVIVDRTPASNGSLAVFADGSQGVYVRHEGRSVVFDLQTGATLSTSARGGSYLAPNWRLAWIDGKIEVDLLRVNEHLPPMDMSALGTNFRAPA